jgi:ketol-acid reductoisomerase
MKHLSFIIEGTFEVKLPTIWANGKAEVGRVREETRRKKIRKEKEAEKRRCRCAEKVVKSRFTVFFP